MLKFLAQTDISTPSLVGVQEYRTEHTPPMVLMTALPGRALDSSSALSPGILRQAAATAQQIHAISPDEDDMVVYPRYSPHYLGTSVEIRRPAWTRFPDMWDRAIDWYGQWKEKRISVLVHRDFHLGNLLFNSGEVSGVVDWVTACFGEAGADIGHMRWNLVLSSDIETADGFTKHYMGSKAAFFEPHWDVLAVVGALPDLPSLDQRALRRLDDFLVMAVRRMGL